MSHKIFDLQTKETIITEPTEIEIQEMTDNAAIAAAEEVRIKRNAFLTASDWVTIRALDNSGLLTSNQAPEEWRLYRQSLRDITKNKNFPYLEESDWPDSP